MQPPPPPVPTLRVVIEENAGSGFPVSLWFTNENNPHQRIAQGVIPAELRLPDRDPYATCDGSWVDPPQDKPVLLTPAVVREILVRQPSQNAAARIGGFLFNLFDKDTLRVPWQA